MDDELRHRARRASVEARFYAALLTLPPRVALFQARARRLAWRSADLLSLTSVTRPTDLRALLALARGRRRVAELGTATGWTAISLALADPARTVFSCDIVARPEPLRYLQLIDSPARARISLHQRDGAQGPPDSDPIDLLYIDSSHERQSTIAEVRAWAPVLRPGAAIVFDDFTHPEFPGVREAIGELGLTGRARGTMFVHIVPANPRPA